MRSVGFATAAGALPVVLLFALARVAVGAVGGGDPFEQHLRDISTSALTVPIRNGSIVFVAGVAMVVAAVVLSRVDRAVSGGAVDAAADEW
jgi:hypothetical protein